MTAFVTTDVARAQALAECAILDSPPEEKFDELARLAAAICGTPVALVSLLDCDRQWFKSRIGFDQPQTPISMAFCAYAVCSDEPLVVGDATEDRRFRDNPLVTGEPHVRFYAGFPIRVEGRHRVGTLCVLDRQPRSLDEEQIDAMHTLASQVSSQLDLRRSVVQLAVAHGDLERARDAAEASSRAKSAFLANMSHEIRTPLTAIMGFADLLADGEVEGDECREALSTIRRSSRHLLGVLNAILDLSAIEAGRVELRPEPMHLAALLRESLDAVAAAAGRKSLELSLHVARDVPATVMLDRARFLQIVTHLLENAVKFTEQGSVHLSASGAAKGVRITVRDTGVGIGPEHLNRIFLPFEQADRSSTRRYGGNGLGLAICRELAAAMNGELTVTSMPGRGSEFVLTMPTDRVRPSRVTARARVARPMPLSGCRVLIVEDGPDNQRLLRFLMSRAGANVEVVSDGLDAIDAACGTGAERGFDIILMDMQMPRMDGYDAARALRSRGITTPILALTADAVVDAREACLAAGCSAFLTKPVDRGELERVCAELIGQSAPAAEPTPTGG